MASGTVIGSLRVVLGADTAAFETGLKDAQKSLNGFAKGAATFGTAAAVAIGAAAAAITASVGHALKQADEIGKASQKFGVPVESLSALKYAADLADVSFESLGKGLGKLSKAMLEGAVDPAGQAAKNFQALGISVKDSSGNIRSTEAVFGDIAEKFSNMEDGAAKTAMAIRIFGKSGADLIPLLNQGKTGLAGMVEEAKKLGLVISADTAAKAEEFNDTMKKVWLTLGALGMRIAEELLPTLQKIADTLLGVASQGSAFNSIIKNLITEEDIRQWQLLTQSIENFVRIISVLKGISFGDIFSGAGFDRLNAAIAENKTRIDALRGAQKQLAESGLTAATEMDNMALSSGKAAKGMGDLNLGALAAKNAIDQFIISQQKSQAAQQADIATANAWIGTREGMRITMEAEAIALANNITLTDKQRAALKALSDQAAANAVQLAGIQMTQANLTPMQAYEQEMQKINQLYAEQAISAETAGRAGAEAARKVGDAYATAAGTALGGFSAMFMAFGAHSKKMFEVGKAFAIAEAVVNTYKAANLALAQPPGPPFSLVYVAGAIAAGIANVMKITSQKAPAFAVGGTMQVAGSGGIDSRMLSFMASPGETVTVDQNKYGQGGEGRTITLAGVSARDYYRGDVLRDFVANLNEAIGDGLKIKLA
jgi:hypothetical protein